MSVNHSSNSVTASHEKDIVNLKTVTEARNRIQQHVHKTPILTCQFFNNLSGRNLFFKCENLQKTGSFKIRGATNSILRVKEEKPDGDFVAIAHSSGNHAQALAAASASQNVKSIIAIPTDAPQVKKNATKGYGANIKDCPRSAEGRIAAVNEVMNELGDKAEFISCSDHPFTIAGQGTVALEMLEEVPDLDAVIACCSPGGLLSGVAIACKETNPNIQVFAVEPESADDMKRSIAAGKRVLLEGVPPTIADGLRANVGVNTWPYIQKYVKDSITCTDSEIVRAMFLYWERMKLIVEPSGAAPLAAVLCEQFKALPKEIRNVGIIVSGGNLDLHKIPWIEHPEQYDLSV